MREMKQNGERRRENEIKYKTETKKGEEEND